VTGIGTAREKIGWLLRRLADRIDDANAPRSTSHSFTFEAGRGFVVNDRGRGCPLWYMGDADYDRAHAEAVDPAPWVDWATMTLRTPGRVSGRRHPHP
jgi:hypothetical protein